MVEIYQALKRCLDRGQLVAVATVIVGPGLGNKLLIWPDGQTAGDLGSAELDRRVVSYAAHLLAAQESGRAAFDVANGTVEVFVDVYPPPPKLIVVGAVHIAIPLVTFAKTLGFRTIVIDARSAFATRERFPHADELIVEWPSTALKALDLDEATYVVVLSHDEKLDTPALHVALQNPVRYVGALGSRKTHAKRVKALEDLGVSAEQLARIHTPIGLDLGGRVPEEIALAIMAEIVAVRHNVTSHQIAWLPLPGGGGSLPEEASHRSPGSAGLSAHPTGPPVR
jgi:xanthine dehydrogenase accessory factor